MTRSIIWEHSGDIVLANRKGGGLGVRLELPTGPGPNSSDHGEIGSSEEVRKPDVGVTDD